MKKRAIVMGATSGIGQEVARLLAANGYEVGIAGRREERLVQMAQATPGIVTHRQIDVTKEDAPTELQKLIEELGGMDLYFHSSGIGWENVALDADKELKTVETNGVGFVRMVSAAYNWFAEQRADEAKQRAEGDEQRAGDKERKARIACITSIARTRGLGAAPAYSATKRMQAHYLECLSQQARMRHLNIGITDIRPGFVATDLIAGSHFPLQLKAEDVARTIVRAIERGSEVVTIDWRYRLLVAAWQLIPRWLWVRLTAIK
ncbi:MAG: SDR family NAD(P)-dependent oxidoreductase [Prevotella sp.]|nr:SDR family NAD(P)-dependent oxidoreductase [Prevotella sp.]MDY3283848.1 SDR family NAD(P)-dependent oxidoreductase [Prevotella sp.]